MATDKNLSAPISDQTPEELMASWLQLQAEWEHMDEQHGELAYQHKDQECIEAMRGQGLQVNSILCLRERDGIPLFLTPSHNLIAAIAVTHAINLPEGSLGHDELRRLKILLEEAALQQDEISEGRAASISNTQSWHFSSLNNPHVEGIRRSDLELHHHANDDLPTRSAHIWLGPSRYALDTLEAHHRARHDTRETDYPTGSVRN